MASRIATGSLRTKVRDLRDGIRFQVRRPNWALVLDERLPFGEIAEAHFLGLLNRSSTYLEFGSGASTLAASKMGKHVVTVESDPSFLEAIQRWHVEQGVRPEAEGVFLHGDVGRTGPWGKPIWPSMARPKRWRDYPLAPWRLLGSDFRADLILVDGRFRVACSLAVAIHQPEGDWVLLVDDYVGRPEYEPISDFLTLAGVHGRMAEFRMNPEVQEAALTGAFREYVSDWR